MLAIIFLSTVHGKQYLKHRVYYKSVFLLDGIRGVDEDDHRGEKADEDEAGSTDSLHAAFARVLRLTHLKIIYIQKS